MPSWERKIQIRNPGEYFACTGLFELASLFDNNASAYFIRKENKFVLNYSADAAKFLKAENYNVKAEFEHQNAPIVVTYKDEDVNFTIVTPFVKKELSLWCGATQFEAALGQCLFLIKKHGFNFDYAVNHNNKLDVDIRSICSTSTQGFSRNDMKLKVAAYPAVEFLAWIGIQRFCRQDMNEDEKDRFYYTLWHKPCRILVASMFSKLMDNDCTTMTFQSPRTSPDQDSSSQRYFTKATKKEFENV